MGCLSGLAGLLALAIPLAIARASLGGAYGLIVIFAALAAAGIHWRVRNKRKWYLRVAVLAVLYAGVVTVVHLVR